jgi:hypothetical protein
VLGAACHQHERQELGRRLVRFRPGLDPVAAQSIQDEGVVEQMCPDTLQIRRDRDVERAQLVCRADPRTKEYGGRTVRA